MDTKNTTHQNQKDVFTRLKEATLERLVSKKIEVRLGFLYLYILCIVISTFIGAGIFFVVTPMLSKFNMPIYGGYVSRDLIIDNINKIDSLKAEVNIWRYYNNNITEIISGEKPGINSENIRDFATMTISKQNLKSSTYEDVLRKKVSLDNRFKKHDYRYEYNFYPPIRGIIDVPYSESKTGGVTLLVYDNTEIVSMNDGTVVAIYRDINLGNVIQIQHPDNMISVYGNLYKISKKIGDKVLSREVIGYVGNGDTNITKLSTASKTYTFYFELWYNGNKVNPENYIVF